MKFLTIDGGLLSNTHLNPTDKIILSILYNLSKGQKKFFGSFAYLAKEIGLSEEYVEKRFTFLEKNKIVKKGEGGWFLDLPFYLISSFDGKNND